MSFRTIVTVTQSHLQRSETAAEICDCVYPQTLASRHPRGEERGLVDPPDLGYVEGPEDDRLCVGE